jgi:ankyrin repeat protein
LPPPIFEQQVSELFTAARNGKLEAVRSLVASGIPADATLKSNPPPMVRAAKSGHLAVVKFLHKNGASEDSKYTALKALAFNLASESDPAARENMDAIATELLFSFRNPEAARNQVAMELRAFDADLAAQIDRLLRFEG